MPIVRIALQHFIRGTEHSWVLEPTPGRYRGTTVVSLGESNCTWIFNGVRED